MDTSASFGRWLKQLRKAHDLTQAALAHEVACSPRTIEKIEADQLRPSRQLAERLGACLVAPTMRATFVQLARHTNGTPAEVLAVEPWLVAAAPPVPAAGNAPAPVPTPPCPYRGLLAFREADAPVFFGRESPTSRLVTALRQQPLVALLGASGSGKSSVVFGGLVPELRRTLGAGLTTTAFRPGNRPFHALAAALLPLLMTAGTEADRLLEIRRLSEHLREGEIGLHDVLEQLRQSAPESTQLLLIVDQFEELFSLCPDLELRQQFVEVLLEAAADQRGRRGITLRIVLTLRADFVGYAVAYRPLADALQDAALILGPMTREELARAIECPAATQRITFEPGLVDRLLDDVGDEPGNLPLLEFALTGLWERQVNGVLTHAAYDASGRVEGALACYADSVYAGLAMADQTHTQRVCVQLVHPGESTEDTRRRATRSELGDEDWALVQQLTNARLVVADRDATGEETAEIAHEALIRSWGRLRAWMERDRTFRAWQERLRGALHQWAATGGDEGALLRGAPLAEAEGWLQRRCSDISTAEQAFIDAGIALRERRAAEREAQRQRELEVERLRAEEHAQTARQLRRRAMVLVAVLLLALVAGGAAALLGERAREQARLATARELAAAAMSTLEIDPERSILLALQAVATTRVAGQRALPETENALHRAVGASHVQRTLVGHTHTVFAIAWSPDGTRLATASHDGTARIWEVASGRLVLTFTGHSAPLWGIAWSPDGTRVATASEDGTAKVWDSANGTEVLTLAGHTGKMRDVAWSPDGTRLATANEDQTAKLWDVRSGRELATLSGHTGWVVAIAWNPDGTRLATAGYDQLAKVWDAATGKEQLTLSGHTNRLRNVVWSRDGRQLATGSTDTTAKVWDAATGRELRTLSGLAAAWSPTGMHLATTSNTGVVKVWDTASGQEELALFGHASTAYAIAFSPDGQRLATGGLDTAVKIWDITPRAEVAALAGHGGVIYDVAYSPDGTRLATASTDKTARVWDATTGKEVSTLAGHSTVVAGVGWSPDGTRLATASFDETAKIWDVASGREVRTFAGHTEWVIDAAFSPDGQRLATASWDRTAKVWDVATGKLLLTLAGHTGYLYRVGWSPDGTRLATASQDKTAKIWDATTGKELLTLSGHANLVMGLAWSPDGTRLTTACSDGTAKVWDAASGQALLTLSGHKAGLYAVDWSPDGMQLATSSLGGMAQVWDARSGQELLGLIAHAGTAWGIAYSPDGRYLTTAGDDHLARVHTMRLDDLIVLARSRLTRWWTPEECRTYLHREECPPRP